MRRIFIGLFILSIFTPVFADVPVVDYSTSINSNEGTAKTFIIKPSETIVTNPVVTQTNLSTAQRITKLEQQVNYLNGQNTSYRIEELQNLVQKLTGQLEDQKYQIEQLNNQLKGFYQDLNQRLVTGDKPSALPPTTIATTSQNTSSPDVITVQNASNAAIMPASPSNVVNALPIDNGIKAENLKPINNDYAILKEQQMYQTAIDLLPDKKNESERKLREYLKTYPKGIYVANVHYWLGEINFLQKNFDAAEEEFKIVVDKFSKSKRISDAALKLALVHQNQGRDEQAKKELRMITKRYPGTSAAQLAKQQL